MWSYIHEKYLEAEIVFLAGFLILQYLVCHYYINWRKSMSRRLWTTLLVAKIWMVDLDAHLVESLTLDKVFPTYLIFWVFTYFLRLFEILSSFGWWDLSFASKQFVLATSLTVFGISISLFGHWNCISTCLCSLFVWPYSILFIFFKLLFNQILLINHLSQNLWKCDQFYFYMVMLCGILCMSEHLTGQRSL